MSIDQKLANIAKAGCLLPVGSMVVVSKLTSFNCIIIVVLYCSYSRKLFIVVISIFSRSL